MSTNEHKLLPRILFLQGASMTSVNRLSTALIGCGAVTQILYAPTVAKLERAGVVEIVALVDPNLERTAHVNKGLSTARQYCEVNSAPVYLHHDRR